MRASLLMGFLLAVALLLSSAPSVAQQPVATTVRGQISAVTESTLTVATRDGRSVPVQLEGQVGLIGLVRIAIADIKPNAFVGVAAVLQQDGTLKAVSVHVFPENLRGTNEGSRAYDVAPGSSMTNGAVAESVAHNDGRTLTVRYNTGEKAVVVDSATSLVRFEPGASSTELKPGVSVVVNGVKGEDGKIVARRVLIGRDGVVPAL